MGVFSAATLQHFTASRRIQMKSAFVCAFLVSAAMGLAACNKAESPDKVQADVEKATSEAAANNAKAN